ncbi:peptidase M6 [Streptomyces tsukubensis]|uniref:Peptidase M6 n=1 Tax=Streptomyces tsukubensis TaxID=83656 RepID=A0A1V4A7D9_9ACTN|nr:peptidase M6 [Streptomyces tsukubensis]
MRTAGAALTALVALAATSLVAGPALAEPHIGPCALERSSAHHSEGVASWNDAYPRPLGRQRAVMVFLSFPDATPRTAPKALTRDYFPATSRFYARASYGRFHLGVDPRPKWIEMPHSSTSYAIERDWAAAHRSAYLRDALAAADPEVDFSRYDLVYFVADPDAPGVDSDATKVVNFDRPLHADGTDIGRVVTVFEKHPPDRNVLAHETGHVYDLPDLYHRPADGKGDWDTYVGDWDVMGSQFGLAPDFFGWHKWKLGWLGDDQVTCVQEAGPARLTLEPLSAPDPATGTRLAVVRTGEDSAVALEARTATGNDADVCEEGVLVYRVRSGVSSGGGPVKVYDSHPGTGACQDASVQSGLADAPVKTGETFTVPGTHVKVAVEGRDASGGWTVQVTTA